MKRRRIQLIEIIQEIADLEWERDKGTNKLKRISCQTLTRFNFGVLEELYAGTVLLNLRLITKINDWADLLETDPEGNPEYPPCGMPEHLYSPEGEDFIRKTSVMEEILSHTQGVLIKFLLSLPAPEQIILSQEAQSVFLKDLDALRVHYQTLR